MSNQLNSKGQFTPNYLFLLLPVVPFIHLDWFGILSNIMELDDTYLVVLKMPNNALEKLNSNVQKS